MSDFKLDICKALQSYGGGVTLKERQAQCLEILYRGQDLIGNLPTGYGKSLIFHLLPALLRNKAKMKDTDPAVVVVICPLNVIQEDQLRSLKNHGVPCCRLDFDCNVIEGEGQSGDLKKVIEGHYDIVFAHPEAFFKSERGEDLLRNTMFQEMVVAVVIDECHKADEWAKEFRTAFKELHTLRAFFQCVPLAALSATLTKEQLKALPAILGLINWEVVSLSPDRPNIFLERRRKDTSGLAIDTYERIYVPLLNELKASPQEFKVTLLYLPMERQSQATSYCHYLFGKDLKLADSPFAIFFANQAKSVTDHVTADLKSSSPHIRLVLCSAAVGMGFDSPCIERVIHACPPRNLTDYFQQVGRAGRSGQPSTATLFFSPSNVARNLPGIQQDIILYCKTESCLRDTMLRRYGFEKVESVSGCKCCSVCKESCKCASCVQSAPPQ